MTKLKKIFLSFFIAFAYLMNTSFANKSALNSVDKQIAVGYYSSKLNKQKPLILENNNNSQTWSFIKHISELPSDFNNPRLVSVKCNGQICIAVGFNKDKSKDSELPLIL